MRELICIVCPRGCHLKVDGAPADGSLAPDASALTVTGNACPRGKDYGLREVTAPTRMVTSTVCVDSDEHPRCPVKTSAPVPKAMTFDVVRALNGLKLELPVALHQVVVKDVCGTGVDWITTRSLEK